MATIQQLWHGNGQGWHSSHTERMHQYFYLHWSQTQRRSFTFVKQVANRLYKISVIDACVDRFETHLMPMAKERYSGGVDDNHLFFDTHSDDGNLKLVSINTQLLRQPAPFRQPLCHRGKVFCAFRSKN